MAVQASVQSRPTNGEAAPIRIGLLGFGTVGTGTYRMLEENREAIRRKVGVPIEVCRIGVRDAEKPRIAPAELFTTDLQSIVEDPCVQVVLELMGGMDPAARLIETALRNGKHVVTANKELIAKQGARLMALASENGLDLHYEAAVGGGIPLIQPLRHQLAGNDVLRLMGIVNGTTNVILTKMAAEGADFGEALAEAQEKGYAEADPSSDIDGFDAQYKLAILATIAFGKEVGPESVYREGIGSVSARDIGYAKALGYTVKLLGIAEDHDGAILARVHPTLLPNDHPLASVNGVYNAVWIQGDFVGDVMLSGKGAGSDATGSAVVGDLIDVCRNIRLGGAGNAVPPETGAKTLPIEEAVTRYYLRVVVIDRPKVLGHIAMALGEHGVSLAAMEMRLLDPSKNLGEIVFLTHPCREASFRAALEDLPKTGVIETLASWMRVEGTSLVVEATVAVKIACVQADVVFGDPQANARAAVAELERLADQGVRLAVFPEAFLTGYCVDSEQAADGIAIERTDPSIAWIAQACDRLGMIAVVGFAERESSTRYNSAALLEPGREPRLHRKAHLPELGLDKFVGRGNELEVFDTAIGKIGVLICFDMRFPEAARVLTLKGADLIALPTNWPEGAEVSAEHICIARAAENRVFFATCNRVGTENGFRFLGLSKIIAPSGLVVTAAGDGAETIVAEVDLALARQKHVVTIPGKYETDAIGERRPDLYSDLAKSPKQR